MRSNAMVEPKMKMGMDKQKSEMHEPDMRRMTYEQSDNGGYVFRHEMEHSGGEYHEPEMHTFGKTEGRAALEHFAKHAGLSEHLKGGSGKGLSIASVKKIRGENEDEEE